MNRGASVVDRDELIRWSDFLDLLWDGLAGDKVDEILQVARECRHPDAQWLVSLFPAGVAVTHERLHEALLEQGEDPRALHLVFLLGESDLDELQRAAEMGYAPAQALWGSRTDDYGLRFHWAQKAASQGYRGGLTELGLALCQGHGCAKDEERGLEWLKEAAELEDPNAQVCYGQMAFEQHDWERYFWWGRAVAHNHGGWNFRIGILELLPLFENSELGRVLHIAGPIIRKEFEKGECNALVAFLEDTVTFERILKLYDGMLSRARSAIACWSIAGRRNGVVKDIRVKIAKLAWEEAWRWGEKEMQK